MRRVLSYHGCQVWSSAPHKLGVVARDCIASTLEAVWVPSQEDMLLCGGGSRREMVEVARIWIYCGVG